MASDVETAQEVMWVMEPEEDVLVRHVLTDPATQEPHVWILVQVLDAVHALLV